MNSCKNCGDETLNPDYCRDCGIERGLDAMECSGCHRMRYRTDPPYSDIGRAFWGEPCACDPRPPSVLELEAGSATT